MKSIFVLLCFALGISPAIGMDWMAEPVTLSTEGVAASNPQVALCPTGDAVAVWIEKEQVLSKTLPYRGSWSKDADVLSQSAATDPHVVLDLNGNATAVWVEGGEIKSSTKPAGRNWSSSPTVISGVDASSPCLAVDPSGNLVAAWVEGGVINSATQMFGDKWSAPERLSSDGASVPSIAIGANGQVVVVWQQLVSSVNTVQSASKLISGSWGAAAIISTDGVNAVYPCVAVDNDGNALAAWFTYIPSGANFIKVRVQTASLPFNGRWSSPIYFVWDAESDPANFVLKARFNADGDGFLFWTFPGMNGMQYVEPVILTHDGSWEEYAGFASPDMLLFDFDVALSGNNALAVWMVYDAANNAVALESSNRYFSETVVQWTINSPIFSGGNSAYPVAAMSTVDGNLYAVCLCLNNNGTNNAVQANTGSQIIVAPPQNLKIAPQVNDYGIVKEYMNLITWEPSPSPQTTAYLLYRNNFVITSVNSSVLQFLDVNQSPGSNNVYTLYAVDAVGGMSLPITVIGP